MIALMTALLLAQAPAAGPMAVEPMALAKDTDLIGREVVVDDRVRFYSSSGKRGPMGQHIFDELTLKRTDVPFRLPPALRPEHPTPPPAARVTGIVRVDGRAIYVDVSAVEPLPADLDRLNREVKRLAADDSAGRSRWASWAERRAKDFKDAPLSARARELETESILLDAARPRADDLALARRARERGLGDDLAAAIAHRGLRAKLEAAKSAADLEAVIAEVPSYLPGSAEPHPLADLKDWSAKMAANPVATYRAAPEPARLAIDRALLGDALERLFDRRLADDPTKARALADEATAKLPDRPAVADRLREHALTATEAKAAVMRLSEVEALARDFRDAGQPERARGVIKTWLDDQRKRLDAGDADGHVILAGQYDRLLSDRATAGELLQGALKAEPQSKPVADAFRRMGFRKSDKGEWYDPEPTRASSAPAGSAEAAPSATTGKGDTLRGKTPEQVRQTLGKPTRVAREATQDATIEQWTYIQGPRRRLIVVIHRPRGGTRAEVVASYSMQ